MPKRIEDFLMRTAPWLLSFLKFMDKWRVFMFVIVAFLTINQFRLNGLYVKQKAYSLELEKRISEQDHEIMVLKQSNLELKLLSKN